LVAAVGYCCFFDASITKLFRYDQSQGQTSRLYHPLCFFLIWVQSDPRSQASLAYLYFESGSFSFKNKLFVYHFDEIAWLDLFLSLVLEDQISCSRATLNITALDAL
jgi:hypothetical protein